jgi:hypothetical protein
MNAIEKKLEGVLLVNLIKILKALDLQIQAARQKAEETDDYTEVKAMNSVRIAVLNKIDQQDPTFHTNYVSQKLSA